MLQRTIGLRVDAAGTLAGQSEVNRPIRIVLPDAMPVFDADAGAVARDLAKLKAARNTKLARVRVWQGDRDSKTAQNGGGRPVIRRIVSPSLLGSVVAVFVVVAPAFSQQDAQDPRMKAARWHLQDEGVHELSSVVVDTASAPQGVGFQRRPLTAEQVSAHRQIAADLGALTGSRAELMICPPGPPDPQTMARGQRQGCRLTRGASAVLQIDAALPDDEGVVVRVVSWIFRENSRGGYGVDYCSKEIRLRIASTGEWAVVGSGLTSRGHW